MKYIYIYLSSFVRSVNMDSWYPKQLVKMKVGGNDKCKEFFRRYGVADNSSIQTKYNSRAASLYREKIEALAEVGGFC